MTAIIIHTCDNYNWIWDKFFECFIKNFPQTSNFSYYFCNEQLEYQYPNFVNQIKTGVGSWSKRLKRICKQLQENSVIYIQEDFLITNTNLDLLINAIDFHNDNNMEITKLGVDILHTIIPITNNETDLSLALDTNSNLPIYQYHPQSKFIMSHQPIAIFNKEYLYNSLSNNMTAREHEEAMTLLYNNGILKPNKIVAIGNKSHEIIEYTHAISDGKLIIDLNSI